MCLGESLREVSLKIVCPLAGNSIWVDGALTPASSGGTSQNYLDLFLLTFIPRIPGIPILESECALMKGRPGS